METERDESRAKRDKGEMARDRQKGTEMEREME